MEQSQELLSSISDSIPLRPSRCLEHIYESLPSVDQLSLQENSNNAKSSSSIDVVENSNKGKANFKKGLNFVNFANLVVANKSEVDLKKLSSNNDKKEENVRILYNWAFYPYILDYINLLLLHVLF